MLAGAIRRIRGGLTSWYGPLGALRFVLSGRRYALLDVGVVRTAPWWRPDGRSGNPGLARTVRFISVLDSPGQQVSELNEFRPQAVGGYPSAILLLAREQAAGRLRIRPLFIIFVCENVPGPSGGTPCG